jgi:phenylalanyl-tRNA synthetase beta chain
MPVLSFRFERLNSFLKRRLSKEKILEILPLLGLNIEDVSDDEIKVEYSPNRPDYGSPAGIAKAINYFYFNEAPRIEFQLERSDYKVYVDKNVKEIRPYIIGMYAKLKFSEETLRELISLQEDLHEGIGRRRRKFAIGLHDASKIKPPIYYTVEAAEFKFIPLYNDKPMSIQEILSQTEQGKLYAHLLTRRDLFPILKDSLGQVLSFPPIINGNVTMLTERTQEIFVDITANELEQAEDALSILATTLMDYGAKVYTVEINFDSTKMETPNLTPRKMYLNSYNIKKILGISLKSNEVIEALKKVNMIGKTKDKQIEVLIPRYRTDILHEVDLIEEVGYGFGYNRLKPLPLKLHQNGRPLKIKRIVRDIRECLIGLGFIEVMTFYLANKDDQKPFTDNLIEVAEPKAKEYNVLRGTIVPQLLKVLASNIHEPYPQKIFEIGRTFKLRDENNDSIKEEIKIAALITHSDASFTEIKSVAIALMNYLGIKNYSFKASMHPYFIEGRCAAVIKNNKKIGVLGEISPLYLQKEGLRNPASGFEIDLENMI